jgi:hypothetical protein
MLDPGSPEPFGRIERRRILRRDTLRAFDAEAPQHRIDKPLMRRIATALRKIDAGCHRSMRWRVQKQKLRDPQPQYVVHPGGAGR